MWASIIIDTSFPPSPIANVIFDLSKFFISFTTWLFWRGETRQHITATASFATSKNIFAISSLLVIVKSAFSSTNIPNFNFSEFSFIKPFSKLPWKCLYSFTNFNITSSCSSLFITLKFWSTFFSIPSTKKVLISLLIKLQLNPILYAVDNLSPVNIHIFISDCLNSLITSGTFSCNLSSTIVEPIKVNPLSILWWISSNFSFLCNVSISACSNSEEKSSHSSSLNIFIAIYKVLYPCALNKFTKYLDFSKTSLGVDSSSLSSIIESAPFIYNLYKLPSLTITLSLFLSDENSICLNFSNLCCSLNLESFSGDK